ncbi:MAG: IclR family transcriptional regulator [Acidimicrobiaceae bacterium]|nr:IclR family transcriptional regulator [Acidimicrobiaceae bacterium]MBP7887820.1 IclR family transcriptional regulator [Ilumatobacteraceae bacterium]MBP9052253.1 IclR family transcriptional regulator [Ilumatobacteraceae bacterium]
MDQLSTVTKALQVLQAFSYEHPVMGVSELGRKLAMGKSSVHRVLSTLAEQGFVVKTEDDRYRLGLKLHELGQLVVSSLELRQVAHAPLERLHNECGETVHVGVLEGTDVMYVHRMEAQSTLRTFSRVGRRVPAHTTSSGKCLLAFGEPEATALVVRAGLQRIGPRSITTERGLIRRAGQDPQQRLRRQRRGERARCRQHRRAGVRSRGYVHRRRLDGRPHPARRHRSGAALHSHGASLRARHQPGHGLHRAGAEGSHRLALSPDGAPFVQLRRKPSSRLLNALACSICVQWPQRPNTWSCARLITCSSCHALSSGITRSSRPWMMSVS